MKNPSKYAIIVAGGKGSRFQSDTPKQFHILNGKPILAHSVISFLEAVEDIHIILVLPTEYFEHWKKIQDKYKINSDIKIASAGDTRFQSVKNGLALIDDSNSLVAIHDGARPLVTQKMICDSFNLAQEKGSAIPLIDVTDSIREVSENGSVALNRNSLRAVQTPQTFQYDILSKSYNVPFNDAFTDDASVVETSGFTIYSYNGDLRNIKITHPIDLHIAQYYTEHE